MPNTLQNSISQKVFWETPPLAPYKIVVMLEAGVAKTVSIPAGYNYAMFTYAEGTLWVNHLLDGDEELIAAVVPTEDIDDGLAPELIQPGSSRIVQAESDLSVVIGGDNTALSLVLYPNRPLG